MGAGKMAEGLNNRRNRFGKPYMATAVDAELQQLTLRGSYAYVSPDFRR